MNDILRDLRYTVRTLARSPGFTIAAVLTLGLGIGLTTTLFSIVYGVVARGLPFERSDRILLLETADRTHDRESLEVFPRDFLDWRRRQTSFEGLAAFSMGTINLSGDREPERYDGALITANGFELLRVRPAVGRGILPADESPQVPPVVVLSDRLWRSRYGGDSRVLGRPVRMNGKPATIVGVMPPGFAFPLRQDLWVPLQIDPTLGREEGKPLKVYGRLRAGVPREAAQAEVTGIVRALEKEYPQGHQGHVALVKPYTEKFVGPEVSSLFYVMLGFGVIVLWIACVNVAGLMVARASRRTRELAIRTVLGASRRRVIAQLLGESALLAIAGSLLGIGLAAPAVRLFNAAIYGHVSSAPPFWIHIAIDRTSLLFVLGATGLTTLASGWIPALRASRADVGETLKDEGRTATSLRIGRLSRAIVVSELAVCCVLLVGAGLMLKSILRLRTVDLGFPTGQLLTARISLFPAQYPESAYRLRFFEELIRQLAARPGIAAAALTTSLPTNGSARGSFLVAGEAISRDRELPSAFMAAVSPGYFRTLGAAVLSGRDFSPGDGAGGPPVAIVNRSLARQAWPRSQAVGRRIRIGKGSEAVWRTVVGVVPDLAMRALQDSGTGPEGFYIPLAQDLPSSASLVLATRGDPSLFVPILRNVVSGIDQDVPPYFVQTMEQLLASNIFFFNLFSVIFSILGGCAMVLSAVGVYGVVAFSVQQRTQEIGVRTAMGATRGNILGLILFQGAAQLGLGLGAGLLLAIFASRPLRVLLFEVGPTDAATYVLVSGMLGVVFLVACLVPAWRASRLEPQAALRV